MEQFNLNTCTEYWVKEEAQSHDELYAHREKTKSDLLCDKPYKPLEGTINDIDQMINPISAGQFRQLEENMMDIKDIEQECEPSNGEQFEQRKDHMMDIKYIKNSNEEQYREIGEKSTDESLEQREENMTNIMYVEPTKDDSLLYCEECKTNHKPHCPIHGPLIVIQNMKVEENDPNRALCSLPPHLLVKESDIVGAGLGVFTDIEILPGTTYGPYEGMFITDPQLANSSDYCWQIYDKNGAPSHFLDGKDTASSNWMRYVNCALSDSDQNLVAFQYKGEIYYRCIKPILPKTELLVWYGDKCAQKFGIVKDKTCELQPYTTNSQENGDQVEPAMHEDVSTRVRTYSEKKSFKCGYCQTICDKQFTQRCNERHSRIDSGEKPYKCEICDMAFSCNSYLVKHRKKHSGVKPYKCGICDKLFSQAHYLTIHTRIHSGEKPYKCEICDKTFSYNSSLVSHRRKHSGEKPYKCDICDKLFSQSCNLAIHTRIHSGEKPYKCEICEKQFTCSRYLVKHMRKHTGEKPFKCDICDKRFSQAHNLRRHTMIHSGEKPYKCEICDKTFACNSYLIKHMRKHSGEKPYKCDICD